MPNLANDSHRTGSISPVHLAVLVLAGTAIRLAASGGDLWIDEVWSLDNLALVQALGDTGSWAALLFHFNTHPLNTIYLALIGPDAPVVIYRLLSIASGAGAIVFAAMIGARHGGKWGLIYGAVVACSYPMIHYASEARGYGPMLFFAFLSVWLMQRHLERPDGAGAAAIAMALVFGLLSHLTFAIAIAGLAAWALWARYLECRSIQRTFQMLAPPFLPAALYLILYGIVAAKAFVIRGNIFEPATMAVAKFAGNALGLDPAGPSSIGLLCIYVAATVTGVIWLFRLNTPGLPLYAVVVVLCPLSAIVVETKPYLLAMYFLITLPFAMLLALDVGRELTKRSGLMGRAVLAAALAFFFASNLDATARFLGPKRGDYGRAVAAIAADSSAPVSVTGSPDFSVGTLIRYHAKRLGLENQVAFAERPAPAARWHIWRVTPGASPPARLQVDGAGFDLDRRYTHWGLSGDTWALYRRQPE